MVRGSQMRGVTPTYPSSDLLLTMRLGSAAISILSRRGTGRLALSWACHEGERPVDQHRKLGSPRFRHGFALNVSVPHGFAEAKLIPASYHRKRLEG